MGKMNITIKVIGPGLTISNEVYLIDKILRDKGYEVEIEDKHPPEKEFDPLDVNGDDVKIKLIAQHCPWGG